MTALATNLTDRIARLAEDTVGADADGWRPLRVGAALASVLAEIDETVLPREIRLRDAGGRELGLFAANRRLHRATTLPDPLADGFGGSIGAAALDDPEGPASRALGEAVAAFLATDGPLAMRSDRTGLRPDPAAPGCAAPALSGAWRGGPARDAGVAQAGAVEQVLAACDGFAIAAVRFQAGRAVARHGDTAAAARLARLGDPGAPSSVARSRCVILRGADGPALLQVCDGADAGFALIPADRGTEAMHAWFEARRPGA
jgi:hypothetical protein